jgi:hypothetical protein
MNKITDIIELVYPGSMISENYYLHADNRAFIPQSVTNQ